MCDAICGYCQDSSVADLNLGQQAYVVVNASNASNIATYHSLHAVEGQTYRIRAWGDLTNDIRSMFVIVADPSGNPIRRAKSNSGHTIGSVENRMFTRKTLSDLDAEHYDTEMGCEGDSHISVVFKALETGVYKIGLGQATDVVTPRSDFPSDFEFGRQWRGGRNGGMSHYIF